MTSALELRWQAQDLLIEAQKAVSPAGRKALLERAAKLAQEAKALERWRMLKPGKDTDPPAGEGSVTRVAGSRNRSDAARCRASQPLLKELRKA